MNPKHSRINNLQIAAAIVAGLALIAFFFPLPARVDLAVPYVSQVPDGQWVTPWSEACEEATITMIDAYYQKEISVDVAASKKSMQDLIQWETDEFNKNYDTDAEQTVQIISKKSGFHATVVRNPSLEDIKRQLAAQRPVIALINMYKLYQENNLGDSYHVLVITGYDDEKSEFIVNDPAREPKRYGYQTMMNALHDFNPTSHEADGVPTVLYTSQ